MLTDVRISRHPAVATFSPWEKAEGLLVSAPLNLKFITQLQARHSRACGNLLTRRMFGADVDSCIHRNDARKFDVRVYTYDGAPLILGARIYQGQTTNLRTQGGGLAAVIPITGAVPSINMC